MRNRKPEVGTIPAKVVCPECLQENPNFVFPHVYIMHLIDTHWDLLERIRTTTGDDNARERLVRQLEFEREMRGRMN